MRPTQTKGESKRTGKGLIIWFVTVLSLCAWSFFRTASDLHKANLSPRRNAPVINAYDIANRSHPSLEKCPNENLMLLFRPQSFYRLASAVSVDSTAVATTTGRSTAHQSKPNSTRDESGEDTSIVWELLGAELDSVVGEESQKKPSRRKVLVVVPGLGEAKRVNLTLNSLESLRRSVLDESSFACLVYVYKPEIFEEVKGRMQHLCEVVFNRGMWTSHMKSVPPLTDLTPTETAAAASPSTVSPALRQLARGVTHVAVMMDDVDVADLDLLRFVALMDFTGFGVASPCFPNEHYGVMRKRCDCVYHRTDFINVLFTVFTRRVWQCWQDHIDPVENSLGWGMDAAVAGLCNTTSGILDVFESHHRGSTKSRLYNGGEANRQMAFWVANHTKVDRYKVGKYLHCVSQQRPFTAFPHCELYWDGTHHSDAAKPVAADWDCTSQSRQ
jgi:hypothetical protein